MVSKKLKFLYTDIGRGHPFYLDGIIEEMNRSGQIKLAHSKSNVFEESKGFNLLLWKLVRFLYKQGGKDNLISSLYAKLRKNSEYNNGSLLISLLGTQIKKKYFTDKYPLIVAHPILVAILKGKSNLIYQHGEVITPKEAVVDGASKILVPTQYSAQPFLSMYSNELIHITGLCIEPALVRIAKDAYKDRLQRLKSPMPLTGCFISSGAEPISHVHIIIESLISHLQKDGKVFLFVKKNGILEKEIELRNELKTIAQIKLKSLERIPYDLPPLTIIQYNSRRDENRFVAHFFSEFDFFVSPSHERTNWAIGLGIPMFITDPPIGPFSPLNRQLLIESETAHPIISLKDAKKFAFTLKKLHINQSLVAMSQNGWGKYPINGFKEIVAFLQNMFE